MSRGRHARPDCGGHEADTGARRRGPPGPNAQAHWVDAPFYSFGRQPLLALTVTRNRQRKTIHATREHRWFVRLGTGSDSRRREVLTRDLRPGQRLAATFPRSGIRRSTPSPFGIAHGFTFGDGTLSGSGSMALVCPPKDTAMLKWFPNSHVTASGDNLLIHHLPRFFKDLRTDTSPSRTSSAGWRATSPLTVVSPPTGR